MFSISTDAGFLKHQEYDSRFFLEFEVIFKGLEMMNFETSPCIHNFSDQNGHDDILRFKHIL